MKTAFDRETGEWQIDWPGRISRHDLVYLSPPDDPMTGLMVGNGEVGALCYVDGGRIIITINRSDLWDDSNTGAFNSAAFDEEEHHTTLRHGGRVIIDFKTPVFDLIYLSDFHARLSLADGRIEMNASGPFGRIGFTAFVCYEKDAVVCTIENGLSDTSVPMEIGVERFGSRMFHRWYNQINPDASLGLGGTSSHADEGGGYITHRLSGGVFALGCRVIDDSGVTKAFQTEGRHRAVSSIGRGETTSYTLVCAITGPSSEPPLPLVNNTIRHVFDTGLDNLAAQQRQCWKAFWTRSLMESGDDFLDNLWHLVMYYSNASQRGSYPGRFCGLLWNWQHDFQAWGFYFHFNQQQIYWPLQAAGHHDLVASYLEMRYAALDHARDDALSAFGVHGAVVSDVTDRLGNNSKSEFHNHTPVAQLALEFWRQYQFSRDINFLQDRVLPYMIEAAQFFLSLFELEPDGLYHAKGGSAYEGGPIMRDAITELATARMLFPAVIQALERAGIDHPDAAAWQDVADHLAPLPIISQSEEAIRESGGSHVICKGLFHGMEVPGNITLAAGWGKSENRLLTSFAPHADNSLSVHAHPMWLLKGLLPRLIQREAEESTYGTVDPAAWDSIQPETDSYHDKIFPGAELSAVFPSGYIGLAERETEQYGIAVTTAKLFANELHGWIPFGPILARLGLRDEFDRMLEEIYEAEPVQVNGTVVDSSGLAGEFAGPEAPLDLRSSLAHYTTGEGRVPILTKTFRFFSIPSGLACAMNEMLLQSHDGVIRVGPAVSDRRSARFTLHAIGGFVVSAEVENGTANWITVRSTYGGVCRIENPWRHAFIDVNGSFVRDTADDLIHHDCKADDLLLIVPSREILSSWEVEPSRPEQNLQPKRCRVGKNMLGLPRMF